MTRYFIDPFILVLFSFPLFSVDKQLPTSLSLFSWPCPTFPLLTVFFPFFWDISWYPLYAQSSFFFHFLLYLACFFLDLHSYHLPHSLFSLLHLMCSNSIARLLSLKFLFYRFPFLLLILSSFGTFLLCVFSMHTLFDPLDSLTTSSLLKIDFFSTLSSLFTQFTGLSNLPPPLL